MPFTCEFFEVSDEQLAKYEAVFGMVNVYRELCKMELWLQANPHRRKKRVHRFIVNWLAKNQRDMEAIDQREITRHEIQRAIARNY